MHAQALLGLSVLAPLVSAHFSISYPEWRGDSLDDPNASQYTFPCANVNQTAATNRTEWPLTGGSVILDLHHKWEYIFVNLGLGTQYPTNNISLTNDGPLNITGSGELCVPEFKLPSGVTVVDGQNATIQVVTISNTGAALYNCADITFRTSATILSGDRCPTNPNITIATLAEVSANGSLVKNVTATGATNGPANLTENAAPASTSKPSSAATSSSSLMTAGFVGAAAVLMSWLL